MERIEAAMPTIAGVMVAIVIVVLWPWSWLTGVPVALAAGWGVRRLSRPDSRSVDNFN